MIGFLKAQLSSLMATAVDFSFTIFLVELAGMNYIAATINGALAGAAVNFMVNKYWSFRQSESSLKKQGFRYGLVWMGSLVLNVAGSNLLISVFKTPYVISKILVSVIVGITFNYTLQKYYVFGTVKKIYKK